MSRLCSPASGKPLDIVASTPEDVIPKIFQHARAAQAVWSKLSFKERSVYIYKIRDFVVANAERIAQVVSKCNGKTRVDAYTTEVLPAVLSCNWYAKNSQKVLSPKRISPGHFLFLNKSYYVEHTPVGVVGIISPWNYPFSIPFGEIIMGLMAGNAIILKVGTPVVLVGELIDECIKAANLPEGLFSHVNVSGAKVSKLFLENGINKIFFTGSVNVGKQLMREASNTLTPLSLELGGKDPVIICEDADLERAVNCICWAGYQNAGQSCGGVERVYVHRSRYDEFVQLLCAKTEALRHGCSEDTFDVDIGSLTTQGQLKIVEEQVQEALTRGAKIAAQSKPVGNCSKGYFYPATVLLNVTHDMRIMKEENFGPILPIVSYDSIEQAISYANDNTMALTAGVFSTNLCKAREIASRIDAGVVTINDHLYTHGMAETPWGGWKDSGIGRTHGELGLKEMSNAKCISCELIPSRFLPRNLWWYPFNSSTYNCLQSLVHLIAPKSCCGFIKAAATAVPFALEKMLTPWNVPNAPASQTHRGGTILASLCVLLVVSFVSSLKFVFALLAPNSSTVQN